MDAAAFALRKEIERLAVRWSTLATYAARLGDFDEAWLATSDHDHYFEERDGAGRRVAVERQLIDPSDVELVPRRKRIRVTAEGLAMHAEALQRETTEFLDRPEIGAGNLIPALSTLADAMDLATRRLEELMRLA